MSTPKRNCIKNHAHMFETVEEYDTHIVKQCLRCRIRTWIGRKQDKIDAHGEVVKVVPIPTMLTLQFFD